MASANIMVKEEIDLDRQFLPFIQCFLPKETKSVPGVIHGIDVDTLYFTGNYAPRCSIQAACINKNVASMCWDGYTRECISTTSGYLTLFYRFSQCSQYVLGWIYQGMYLYHFWLYHFISSPEHKVLKVSDIGPSWSSCIYGKDYFVQSTNFVYPFHIEHKSRAETKIGSEATTDEYRQIKQLHSENWEFLVPLTSLEAGYKSTSHNYFTCHSNKRFTHLRLNIYPDGGIARLRVYGNACINWSRIAPAQTVDLVAMENGGVCLGYSDAHYGHPRYLIQPGRAKTMADGWETARKVNRPAVLQADKNGILQSAGTEWCTFRLGHPGIVTKIEIDTNHFKGNFPDSCRIEGCLMKEASSKPAWKTLLPNTKLSAHNRLLIDASTIQTLGEISHIKLIIAPDGGISRLRLYGHKASSSTSKL